MPRTVVVLPTYNEAENLPLIVPAILAQAEEIEVLIVDDDSPDGTGKLANQLVETSGRIHVLHRVQKRGLGAAYRAGLARALELGADYIIQMDADFSHPPDQIPTLLREIEEHDVVLGSRYLEGVTVVNWPIERILISYFGNQYAKRATGVPISDMTGGFRCVRRELLERMGFERIKADGYAFQIEMNYRFVHQDARIKEISFLFLDRVRGDSKLSWKIGFEALWIVWWLRFASATGRL
ncbi:MAG: polyprenol monophosphomannose synthase [Myxococcota bacterium]